MPRRVTLLGSTGSVGRSTLKVIAAMPGQFEIALLAAYRSREALLEQAQNVKVETLAIGSAQDAAWLRERLPNTRVVAGPDDLEAAIADAGADITISAIVGAAGLRPTMAAIRAGSTIGLANKESMVVAGEFVKQLASDHGVAILPIDSEHNALHQCMRGERHTEIQRLILTASGGPFRTFSGDMATITPEQALAHPTWDMGRKISIDSATMMNKGLEVIEAHHLFDMPGDRISIVVHPQSCVHSLIETVDGSMIAQLGRTDMCDPIQYALTYPERKATPFQRLDITQGLELSFFPADPARFPCIELAYNALAAAGGAPAVLNAANEITVAAFLDHRIRFTQIAQINGACLDQLGSRSVTLLDDVLQLDRDARNLAQQMVEAP